MKVLVDANIIVAPVLFDDMELLNQLKELELYVPDLFFAEVGNAIMKYVRFKDYDLNLAQTKMKVCYSFPEGIIKWKTLSHEILSLCEKESLSYYDAIYLQICINQKIPLYTLDKKLTKVASSYNLLYETLG